MGQPSKESKGRWLKDNLHRRPTINRSSKLRNIYGISPEEYDMMLARQENKCAICLEFLGPETKDEHLDHDHSSGWVRGILCPGCNHGIGHFKEDVNSLKRAIDYLVLNATPTEFNIYSAREKLRIKSRGNTLPRTEMIKEKLRTARLGVPAWNKGKVWDEQTKEKMSVSANKRWENSTEEELEFYRKTGSKSAAVRWERKG